MYTKTDRLCISRSSPQEMTQTLRQNEIISHGLGLCKGMKSPGSGRYKTLKFSQSNLLFIAKF